MIIEIFVDDSDCGGGVLSPSTDAIDEHHNMELIEKSLYDMEEKLY